MLKIDWYYVSICYMRYTIIQQNTTDTYLNCSFFNYKNIVLIISEYFTIWYL